MTRRNLAKAYIRPTLAALAAPISVANPRPPRT
jgi:hypothetical protein